jgi:hypothetical protein
LAGGDGGQRGRQLVTILKLVSIDGPKDVLWSDAGLVGRSTRRHLDNDQATGHHGVIDCNPQPAVSCCCRL